MSLECVQVSFTRYLLKVEASTVASVAETLRETNFIVMTLHLEKRMQRQDAQE